MSGADETTRASSARARDDGTRARERARAFAPTRARMSFAAFASASGFASAARADGRGRARGAARGDSASARAVRKSVARASRKSVADVSSDADASEKTLKRSPSTMVTSVVEEEEDGLEHVYEKARWIDARAEFRPTQVALGWDWTFYKLSNFKDVESATAYMARKPIPYVKYRGLKYVVDHHHTLAALNLAGWDIDVYMEEIFEYDDDLTEEMFWGIMEGKGWSFCVDQDYQRLPPSAIPTSFELTAFRNDIFRSLGGFARKAKLLKRGKMLEEKLFFEFQWGYFFWLHRNDEYALWPSSQLQRGFNRLLTMIEQTDDSEYIGEGHLEASRDVRDMIFLSDVVLQPLYEVLVKYVAPLAYAYATLPTDEARFVPGLKKRFGRETLPGSVITGQGFDFLTERQNFTLPSDGKKDKKDKDKEKSKDKMKK